MQPDDPHYFESLLQRYGQTLYAHCLSRVGGEVEAADAMRGALMAAFKHRHQLPDEKAVAGFLLRSADRRCDLAIAKAKEDWQD